MRTTLSNSFLLCGFALMLIIGGLLASCEQAKDIKDRVVGEPDTSALMLEVERLYEQAKKSGDKVPENLTDWVKQDIQKVGDWEYKVVKLPFKDTLSLEGRLNKMGRDRWEVFWVEPEGADASFFLKRPARSYIKSIPLSNLLKMFPSGLDGPSG